jgi:hypothetical protein
MTKRPMSSALALLILLTVAASAQQQSQKIARRLFLLQTALAGAADTAE